MDTLFGIANKKTGDSTTKTDELTEKFPVDVFAARDVLNPTKWLTRENNTGKYTVVTSPAECLLVNVTCIVWHASSSQLHFTYPYMAAIIDDTFHILFGGSTQRYSNIKITYIDLVSDTWPPNLEPLLKGVIERADRFPQWFHRAKSGFSSTIAQRYCLTRDPPCNSSDSMRWLFGRYAGMLVRRDRNIIASYAWDKVNHPLYSFVAAQCTIDGTDIMVYEAASIYKPPDDKPAAPPETETVRPIIDWAATRVFTGQRILHLNMDANERKSFTLTRRDEPQQKRHKGAPGENVFMMSSKWHGTDVAVNVKQHQNGTVIITYPSNRPQKDKTIVNVENATEVASFLNDRNRVKVHDQCYVEISNSRENGGCDIEQIIERNKTEATICDDYDNVDHAYMPYTDHPQLAAEPLTPEMYHTLKMFAGLPIKTNREPDPNPFQAMPYTAFVIHCSAGLGRSSQAMAAIAHIKGVPADKLEELIEQAYHPFTEHRTEAVRSTAIFADAVKTDKYTTKPTADVMFMYEPFTDRAVYP